MSVADILSGIGKVGRTVGEAALPILDRTAQVISGEAPQIDQQERQHAQSLDDAALNAKADELEAQLEMGRKYGTLTPEQQKQYVDQITGLFSHPRHMNTLMTRLQKAIHPNGVTYSPNGPLPDATPKGGTVAADEAEKEKAEAAARAGKLQDAEDLAAFRAKLPKSSTAKSPPLPGDQLPSDAVDPSGNPIGETDRNAGKSFVQWNGAWWPVAKQKPVLKKVQGHLVLIDPLTGNKLRDIGPEDTAKITRRQTLQPGDDGQMHLVTLTSVSTPEGATIDVDESDQSPAAPATSTAPQSPSAPKSKGVASVLPKRPATGARPAALTGSSGPVVPGLTSLAKSKTLAGKSQAAQYTKASEDANAKKLAYQNAAGLLADNTRQTDLELVYAWVRANVQGAGRMTNTEIQQTATAGSWGMRLKNQMEQASTGRLAPEMEQQFLSDIKRSYENAQKEANDLDKQLAGDNSTAPPDAEPPAAQPKVLKYNAATGRLE